MSTDALQNAAATQRVEGVLARREEPPAAPEPSAVKEYGVGLLKSVIAAIPYAGGLLNEALFDARSRLKQDRLNAFFVGVAADVRQLGEEKLDKAFITSDSFSDLIEEVCQRVMREEVEAKRNHFRKILLDAMQGKASPSFEKVFIDVLGEVTEAELDVLKGSVWAHFRMKELEREGKKADIAPIDYSQPTIKGYSTGEYRMITQSLIRKGLMFDDSHGRFGTQPYVIVAATDLGAEFYQWLTR